MNARTLACGLAAAVSALSGCCALPDKGFVGFQHESHMLQHEPFTSTPTNFGSDAAKVSLEWDRGPLRAAVSELYNLDPNGANWDGCSQCPREAFQADIGLMFPLKP